MLHSAILHGKQAASRTGLLPTPLYGPKTPDPFEWPKTPDPFEWSTPLNGELDGQHIAGFAGGIFLRRPMHGVDRRIGKGVGVKPGRRFGVAVVPEANDVLCWLAHVNSSGNEKRFIRLKRSQ
jgi:hypothetical protein